MAIYSFFLLIYRSRSYYNNINNIRTWTIKLEKKEYYNGLFLIIYNYIIIYIL